MLKLDMLASAGSYDFQNPSGNDLPMMDASIHDPGYENEKSFTEDFHWKLRGVRPSHLLHPATRRMLGDFGGMPEALPPQDPDGTIILP